MQAEFSLRPAAPQIDIELDGILKSHSVTTHFQPMISIRERAILAVEALSRGVHPDSGLLIPPALLFSLAKSDDALLELDRLCRQESLENFARLGGGLGEQMLSLNLEASLLELGGQDSNYLLNSVRSLELEPGRVIVEIVESRVRDFNALQRFVKDYQRYGFLVALDDVGAGYVDLVRIAALKPDLIKIDRSLVKGMDKKPHQKEAVRALIELSHRIGALAVVEGVERESEVVCAMNMNADFMQGYFFAKPGPRPEELEQVCLGRMQAAASTFASYKQNKIQSRQSARQQHEQVADHLVQQLSWAAPHEFQRVLEELIGLDNSLECMFVLDGKGIQVTETVFNPYRLALRRKSIFKAASAGSDQSLKEYYFMARTRRRKFISDPYISMATGLNCITIAVSFKDQTGGEHILCCDFAQQMRQEPMA